MCGRFTLTAAPDAIAVALGLPASPTLHPRYNIAPTQAAAIVRAGADDATRRLDLAQWGLIPSWAKEPGIGVRLINARAETLAEKPAFRKALRERRCLVPADGFIEWVPQGKLKQPYWITLQDRAVFAFAGLWESWIPAPDSVPIVSFTIITTDANEALRKIHTRMPVMLPPEAHHAWLDPQQRDPEVVLPWLTPCVWAGLSIQPVSRRVNNARNDDRDCLEPSVQ